MKRTLIASAIAIGLTASSFAFSKGMPTIYFSADKDHGLIESKNEFLAKYESAIHRYATMEEIRDIASENGEAAFLMSKLHYFGVYFDQDAEESLEYAEQAFEHDYPKSVSWYRKLRVDLGIDIPMSEWREYAMKGDPLSQFALATTYLEEGGRLNHDVALFLLARSADQGFKPAIELRNKILDSQASEMPMEVRQSEARKGSLDGLKLVHKAYKDGLVTETDEHQAELLEAFIKDYERANSGTNQ